jgi:hypothetical protein
MTCEDKDKNEIAEPSVMDQIEFDISKLDPVVCPLVHLFTPDIYVRQIQMPAGSIITSMKHKTDHPFIITSGVVDVISEFERVRYEGPYMGVTKAGTKRILHIIEDTIWLTIHSNKDNLSDPNEIAELITEPIENPLFKDKDDPRYNMWKTDVSPSLTCNFKNNYKIEKLWHLDYQQERLSQQEQ